ncbi:hypothetical protein [Streptosporangium oxazolinicum]
MELTMEPALLVVAVLVIWVISDWIRNYLSKCRKCQGSGTLKATFFPRQYRPCPRCSKGEVKHGFAPKK